MIIELATFQQGNARPSGVYNWSKFWDVGKCFMYLWEAIGTCWFRILWSHLIEFSFTNFSLFYISFANNFAGPSLELL